MSTAAAWTRRRFVKVGAGAMMAGPTILTSLARGAESANERITLGFIGVGVRTRGELMRHLSYKDVQVLAVCDVEKARRDDAHKRVTKKYGEQKKDGSYKGCKAYTDFRELLARKDIDAVVIGTPDHAHAIPAIQAARAGKDIYCEKPLSVCIGWGRAMVNAVRKHDVIFQTGSQQRTEFGGKFRLACELIRNGRIGEVKTVRVGVGPPPTPCDLPTEDTPDGTDWDLWLGPAPQRGYNHILCPKGIHGHFPAWRQYREYAGGSLADMGAHHFDIAQWALDMDTSGPVEITPPEDGAKKGLRFRYANGVVMYHGYREGGTFFEGTEGEIFVGRSKLVSTPESIVKEPILTSDIRLPRGGNQRRNWLDAIRKHERPICDVETGHRSATVCHLANIGYQLGRPLKWDPAKERFDDSEANNLIDRDLREPWTL